MKSVCGSVVFFLCNPQKSGFSFRYVQSLCPLISITRGYEIKCWLTLLRFFFPQNVTDRDHREDGGLNVKVYCIWMVNVLWHTLSRLTQPYMDKFLLFDFIFRKRHWWTEKTRAWAILTMAYFNQDVSQYIQNHLVDKMTVRLSVSAMREIEKF